MRKRYVTSRNRQHLYSYSDEPVHLAGMTVFELEPQIIETGLLDVNGNPIFSIEAMGPIGFIHHGEGEGEAAEWPSD
jgi:hypothetical protein